MVHSANHNWQKIQSKKPILRREYKNTDQILETEIAETVLICERVLNSTELNDLFKQENISTTMLPIRWHGLHCLLRRRHAGYCCENTVDRLGPANRVSLRPWRRSFNGEERRVYCGWDRCYQAERVADGFTDLANGRGGDCLREGHWEPGPRTTTSATRCYARIPTFQASVTSQWASPTVGWDPRGREEGGSNSSPPHEWRCCPALQSEWTERWQCFSRQNSWRPIYSRRWRCKPVSLFLA